MEAEEKQRLIEQIINSVSEFGEYSVEISRCQILSIFRWTKGMQWQSDLFSWFTV